MNESQDEMNQEKDLTDTVIEPGVVLTVSEPEADDRGEEPEASDETEEEEKELSAKEKKKLINVENLTRKFKSQVQGNQKKISTWEDRTVAKLKQMGFRSAGFGEDGKWRLQMGTLTACISSNHGPRSSTGFLKFTDSAPKVETAEAPKVEE